ncbi:hypothetical protein C5167_040818 [Papaver somniferum]|uniref:Uncharacterized protein n=1 Tax=Papaver somniferum TaxID=3469 RepID=A0A4Y7IJG8_PAPSO|nr:hypothetical protein C5167_040818 [Papaver somniferum]
MLGMLNYIWLLILLILRKNKKLKYVLLKEMQNMVDRSIVNIGLQNQQASVAVMRVDCRSSLYCCKFS